MDKIKQAFEEREKFIDKCTPEELQKYEDSLNLDYDSYRTPEEVVKSLPCMQDMSNESIKQIYKMVKHGDDSEASEHKTDIDKLWFDIQHYGERIGQTDFKDEDWGYYTVSIYKYNNHMYSATMINGELNMLMMFLPIGGKIMGES